MEQNKLVVVSERYIESLFGKVNYLRKLNDQYVGTYLGDGKVELDFTGKVSTIILTNVDIKYLSEYIAPKRIFYTYEQLSKLFPSTENLELFHIKNEHLTIGSEYDLREETEKMAKMLTNYNASIELELFNLPLFTEALRDKYKISIYINHDSFDNHVAYEFHVDYAVQLQNNDLICLRYIDEPYYIGFTVHIKKASKCIALIEKEL